ncbi:MAG: hypothetical protein JSS98_14275 [Bacteroidetes bacterium]|nr:hypothetical protein [Bacteroidota bacterium]
MYKKIFLFLSFFCVILLTYKVISRTGHSLKGKTTIGNVLKLPLPTEGEENEELREKYFELKHRAAPGISWQNIENQNMIQAATAMQRQAFTSSFANGNITGSWSARGANNITGSVRVVDYEPGSNTIYTISNGGSLWSSFLGSGSWSLLNQNYRFDQTLLKAFKKNTGGVRIMLEVANQLYYSDDNGQTINLSTFPSNTTLYSNNGIYFMNDGSNSLYCLARSSDGWFRFYKSTDEGLSFSVLAGYQTSSYTNIAVCKPYNINEIYLVDKASTPGTLKLYKISGSAINQLSNFVLGHSNSNYLLKGTYVGGVYYLYLMIDNNTIYLSTDQGASWTLQSTFSEGAWNKMNVSMTDPAMVFYGGVNAYKSSNSGVSFTKINDWSEYYGNIYGKLHADIMEIEFFKKTDNTEFAIINCHGGVFVSYDKLTTVSNQSLSTLGAVELYDVITDTLNPERIYTGSQDQGFQRTLTGTSPGVQNFIQVISGDYGQLSLTGNNTFAWPQYPGGTYYLYTNLQNANPTYISYWALPGTQKPNYGWMLPATATANASENSIWLGGGNLTGGGGSYLIKATLPFTSPYTVTATQFNFDFRANSNNTTSGITAIEQSLIDNNKLYVATEDGTFFYSNDLGVSWNKTTSFNGPTPWYLYGSCILASRIDSKVIWYSGSGYSNGSVFKSINGGVSFTSMSNGLPNTLVNEIVATPDEKFIFAATDAGPFVYVVSDNKWYSLADNTSPVQFFSSVEYIRSQNIVRFGTMGRGIWDFIITSTVPVTFSSFNAVLVRDKIQLSWTTGSESHSKNFKVQRSLDGAVFETIGTIPAAGNSSNLRSYIFNDLQSINLRGRLIYYRIAETDIDGEEFYTNIQKVKIPGDENKFRLVNNPVSNEATLRYEGHGEEKIELRLIDPSGKVIKVISRKVQAGINEIKMQTSDLAKGIYEIELIGSYYRQAIRMVKQ